MVVNVFLAIYRRFSRACGAAHSLPPDDVVLDEDGAGRGSLEAAEFDRWREEEVVSPAVQSGEVEAFEEHGAGAEERAVERRFVLAAVGKALEADELVAECRDVIRREHFEVMKDGVLLANSGHFDVEIDKAALADLSDKVYERKPHITGYHLRDGRTLNLLAEGRLVNLAAGNGHPAEIMDMSFVIQAKGLEYLVKTRGQLLHKLYAVPREIDEEVARIKLESMNVRIDVLSDEQKEYMEKVE